MRKGLMKKLPDQFTRTQEGGSEKRAEESGTPTEFSTCTPKRQPCEKPFLLPAHQCSAARWVCALARRSPCPHHSCGNTGPSVAQETSQQTRSKQKGKAYGANNNNKITQEGKCIAAAKKKGSKRQPLYEHNERISGHDKHLPIHLNKKSQEQLSKAFLDKGNTLTNCRHRTKVKLKLKKTNPEGSGKTLNRRG